MSNLRTKSVYLAVTCAVVFALGGCTQEPQESISEHPREEAATAGSTNASSAENQGGVSTPSSDAANAGNAATPVSSDPANSGKANTQTTAAGSNVPPTPVQQATAAENPEIRRVFDEVSGTAAALQTADPAAVDVPGAKAKIADMLSSVQRAVPDEESRKGVVTDSLTDAQGIMDALALEQSAEGKATMLRKVAEALSQAARELEQMQKQ